MISSAKIKKQGIDILPVMIKLNLNKMLLSVVLLQCVIGAANAQSLATDEPIFGKVDTAEFRLTSCDFEKDANAEVLFDKAVVSYKYSTIIMDRYKRIKIFNEKGKDEADFRIEFLGVHKDEDIVDLQAETVNLEGNQIIYTPVDSKSIYTTTVDKYTKAISFSFPAVKPGSVIEVKYKKTTPYPNNYPDWYFQSAIPTKYSEFDATFQKAYNLGIETKLYQPLVKNTAIVLDHPEGTRRIWAMQNVGSYKQEPFTDYPEDYIESILVKDGYSRISWKDIGDGMMEDPDFGEQLKKNLAGEDQIISNAGKLKTDKEKIAYLFDTVRNAMTWNKTDRWYCVDGVRRAWEKKAGNSTEINLILYNLLAEANINTLLLVVRNKEEGKLDESYPSWYSLDKVVLYAQADTSNFYVLDASDKLNTFDNTPDGLAGLRAFQIATKIKFYSLVNLPLGINYVTATTTGEITPDGKLKGSTLVRDWGYAKKDFMLEYNGLGEKKYEEKLEHDNNGLKVNSLKVQLPQSDTVPVSRTIDFSYNLTDPDGGYLYFNPSILTGLNNNPFLSDTRVSDINFGGYTLLAFKGRYKIPAGYKTDALPKSVTMEMPDKGIIFKRIVAEQDGYVIANYLVDYERAAYEKTAYPSIRDFYKKMFEMLNEQVVLKKL